MKTRSVTALLALALLLSGRAPVPASRPARFSDGKGVAPARPAPAPREKFALLVGVNAYKHLPPGKQLNAPENDAALMKELLVKQYGFKDDAAHIKTLLSGDATKQAITDAFAAHLVANAARAADAVVVFYFSGHGSFTADLNDDEGDGRDETIVPSDSRGGGVTDILDDDINEWFESLQRHTPNITFILDSCNSGTATKTIDPDVKAKELEPDAQPQPQQKKRPAGAAASKDIGSPVLSRNDKYVTVSGCQPTELSYEAWFTVNNVRQRRSYMTHYLVQTLRRAPSLSYREAVELTAKEVLKEISQHPQAEGDTGRPFFGGPADGEDPFIKLSAKPNGRTLHVAAGTAHGIEDGAILAVYKPEAKKLVGEKPYKLVNARVTKANELDSVAEMQAAPAEPVPENAKVVIVTPGLGADRLRVVLSPAGVPAPASAPDAAYAASVRASLSAESLRGLVEVVAPGAAGKSWDFALLKARLRDVRPALLNPAPSGVADDADVYYFASRGADRPLFDLLIPAAAADGPRRLADALGKKAKQDKLRALYNAASPLNGKVRMTLTRVFVEQNPDCTARLGAGGKPIVLREEVVPAGQGGVQPFNVCDRYKFTIHNDWDRDLHVTIFYMGAGGTVDLLTADSGGKLVSAGRSFTTSVFRIGPPKGIETYKLIATTEASDFRFVRQPGAKLAKDYSPLDLLVDQVFSGGSKDPGREAGFDLASWTVAQMDFTIK